MKIEPCRCETCSPTPPWVDTADAFFAIVGLMGLYLVIVGVFS